MRFTPRQVMVMVVAVCAAFVAAPVGVMAATGQLVNITDPAYSGRKARVSADGLLRVDSRAAVPASSFQFSSPALTSLTFHKLMEASNPDRLAITEMSFSSGLFGPQNGWSFRADVVVLKRTSGSAECHTSAAGWTATVVRTVEVPINNTVTLDFSGSPLLSPAAPAGHKTCMGVVIKRTINDAALYVGGTGYRYRP